MEKVVEDRRRESRYRVKKPGSIRCLATERQVDVEVQEMSASGARVQTFSSADEMVDIELHVHHEDLHIPARVQWRQDDLLGLALSSADATVKKSGIQE